jgi:lysophospholipase L1-like esterase
MHVSSDNNIKLFYMNTTGRLILGIAILTTLLASCEQEPVLYLAGDSTMSDKPPEAEPERGWGQMLPQFFNESIRIENHARNGRSTRSFRYEGRWDSIMSKVKKGDYVIIQFGHNDDVESKIGRHTTPREYAYNLEQFVKDTREREATPILCTPIVRRRFDDNGQFYYTHGVYPDKVREVAKEFDVPLIDLHRSSERLIVEMGEEKSIEIFLHFGPGVNPRYPDGRKDNTHFSKKGGAVMAELAAEAIRELDINLKEHLK